MLQAMRYVLVVLVLIALAVVAAAIYFRLAPMPAETWHVDPATATAPDSPNFTLRRGADAIMLPDAPATVAARLAATAEGEGATLIAGALEDGFATYVVRSRLMGYPDAISIRLTGADGGTRAEVFSRSRFGYSDMGVNAARVARWFDLP